VRAHISPAHSENINIITVTVTVDGDLAKLDERGLRPLRPTAPAPALDTDR
jgi:hypothetical protein